MTLERASVTLPEFVPHQGISDYHQFIDLSVVFLVIDEKERHYNIMGDVEITSWISSVLLLEPKLVTILRLTTIWVRTHGNKI